MALQLKSGVDHCSKVVTDVSKTVDFYVNVLGFTPISRPSSFKFDGAWLWRSGIALHFIEGVPVPRSPVLDPRVDHISFQADSMPDVEAALNALGIPFIKAIVEDHGVQVEQIFFMDPDYNTIEICNCGCLPIRFLEHKAAAALKPHVIGSCAILASDEKAAQQCNNNNGHSDGAGSCYSSDSEMRVSLDLHAATNMQ